MSVYGSREFLPYISLWIKYQIFCGTFYFPKSIYYNYTDFKISHNDIMVDYNK